MNRPITDVIFCARSKTRDPRTGAAYYGAYPAGFLDKARLIIGCPIDEPLWHICGGFAHEYNGIKGGVVLRGFGARDVRIDIDPGTNPDVLMDVRYIGNWMPEGGDPELVRFAFAKSERDFERPRFAIIDRPYTPEDADKYACGREVLPDINKLLRDALALVVDGGTVGVLDYFFPSAKNGECVGVYPVIAGTNCRVRVFTVWRKR